MTFARIAIVGTTGSGKTTLARQLSQRLNLRHIEIDSIFWQPNWTPLNREVLKVRISELLTAERWVIDGNYSAVRPLIFRRADTVIWLGYPIYVNLYRLFWRSLTRSLTREKLWASENQESLRTQFLSRDSLFVWALTTYRKRRLTYRYLMAQPEYAHIQWLRLGSPWATQQWLRQLQQPGEFENAN